MTQLSLDFEGVRARTTDPITSVEAASQVNNSKIRSLIISTLNHFFPNGASSNEIARKVGKPRDHISPHMNKLMILNYVEKAGIKKDPVTGKNAIVWKAVKSVEYVPITHGLCPYCGK